MNAKEWADYMRREGCTGRVTGIGGDFDLFAAIDELQRKYDRAVACLRLAEQCILEGFEPAHAAEDVNKWEQHCRDTVGKIRAAILEDAQ